MSGLHARVGFSKLAMCVACPGSVVMQEHMPPHIESEEEAEGTAAHLPAMAHASGNPWPIGAHFESGGKSWTVDHDMHIGAKMWARGMGGTHGDLRLEDAVRASAIHVEHCWGTPDGWRYMDVLKYTPIEGFPWSPPDNLPVIRIGDYKFGHRYVEIFENYQLLGGTVGVLERLEVFDFDIWIEWVLVQPRAYHREGPIRVWRARASSLRALINIAYSAVDEALGPDPTCHSGPHCKDCDATAICTTLMNAGAHIVDYSSKALPDKMTPQAMGVELRIISDALKRLEARKVGLAASVESVLRAGQPVPMWKMAPGRANRAYFDTVTPEEIAMLGDLACIELRKPLAVCTPTQAIEAGIDEKVMEQYSARPKGALSLKPDKAAEVRKIFNRTTDTEAT